MVEPKTYRVKQPIRDRDFTSNNFRATPTQYILNKPLYTEEIILNLTVDKEDYFVSTNVRYANGTLFAPFYNPDDRGNNKLYKKVVKAYNKFMSNMKDIFEDMRKALGLDYISDIPLDRNKEYIRIVLKSLPMDAYSEKEVEEFKKYAFQKRMIGSRYLKNDT